MDALRIMLFFYLFFILLVVSTSTCKLSITVLRVMHADLN
jgi:hypothetical protein